MKGTPEKPADNVVSEYTPARHRTNARLLATGAVVFFTLIACACRRAGNGAEIIPPVTAPLSRQVIGYGVIKSNYTHILDKIGGGTSVALLRRGTIVEIKERRPLIVNGKAESRVFVTSGLNSGWLAEEELNIYSSRIQAETASGNPASGTAQP